MVTSIILLIILTAAFVVCLTLAVVFLLASPDKEQSVSLNLPDGTVKNVETDKGEIRIEFAYGPDGLRQADSVLFPEFSLEEDDGKSGEVDKDFLWKIRNLDNLEQMEKFNVLQTLNRYGFIHQDDIPEMIKEFGSGSHKEAAPKVEKESGSQSLSPSPSEDNSSADDAPSVKGEDDYDRFSNEPSEGTDSGYENDSDRDFDE